MSKVHPQGGVAIIGPGRIGQALGCLLATSRVPVALVAGRNPESLRRAVKFIGQGTPVNLTDPRLLQASILLMTTSDSAIAEVARSISRMGKGKNAWKGKVVLHTCGSLPSSVLNSFKSKGAAIGSLHPFQTVPNPQAGVRSLLGCYWGIEGEQQALRVARSWIALLDGVAFRVRPADKALYHLAAFITCPTVVTLMAQAASLLKKIGIPGRISRPMLRQFVAATARNFENLGGNKALTGPAMRGDWNTIRNHRKALRQASPEFVPVYDQLLSAMLRLSGADRTSPDLRNSKSKGKSKS
jgi:predicted short-subunit dehydrogenase-like oxidoreductase (DUF2520 family)